jgi:hypothetical protein
MNTNQTPAAPVKITYHGSVCVDVGWRSILIKAEAVPCGRGLAEIIRVFSVDGNDPTATWASRTGARRQSYSPSSVALREVGKRKRLSACEIVD